MKEIGKVLRQQGDELIGKRKGGNQECALFYYFSYEGEIKKAHFKTVSVRLGTKG